MKEKVYEGKIYDGYIEPIFNGVMYSRFAVYKRTGMIIPEGTPTSKENAVRLIRKKIKKAEEQLLEKAKKSTE